jgi:DNA helicase-2/ATP-dependent DNA helicase PcrA
MARRFVLTREPDAPERALTIDYASVLNPQQYAAATLGPGPALVIAGAGTGKTRTLVHRVAYLVETGTTPEEIVLLTFTRRSAHEMLGRAAGLLDNRCSRVRGGTFHAFCAAILRKQAPRIGYERNFTIMDAVDTADVIDVLRVRHGLHQVAKRFPRKRTLQNLFSAARNRGVALDEIVAERYPQFVEHQDALDLLMADFAVYKRQHGLMDYDDLLLLTVDLFERHPDAAREVASRMRHVLVDEYQDTNPAQARLVEHFSRVHGNVMVVGDDAQSIYRFRGADHRNIFAFPERFSGCAVLKLEQNYRSTQPILDLANLVLDRAHHHFDKRLFTQREGGELPAVVPAPDERTESRFVSQAILQLREEGVPLSRMAVLFRSARNSFDLEVALGKAGIPFVKYGGLKLAEAAHIKDVLAHLKVAENVQDVPSWMRILQLIPGVGPKTAQALVEWITSGEHAPFEVPDEGRFRRFASHLEALFAALRSVASVPPPPLPEQVEAILTYYDPLLQKKYFEDFPKRQEDLEHFAGLTKTAASRRDFLESLALDPIEITALGAEPSDEDEKPLVLSTIHSAKGLEFKVVFLIHALDGVLPSGYSVEDPDDLDEELRLLYVAVTRAEDELFISYPMLRYGRYAGEYLTKRSRFLDDIAASKLEPVELVESHTPQLAPAAHDRLPPPPKRSPGGIHDPHPPAFLTAGAAATPSAPPGISASEKPRKLVATSAPRAAPASTPHAKPVPQRVRDDDEIANLPF